MTQTLREAAEAAIKELDAATRRQDGTAWLYIVRTQIEQLRAALETESWDWPDQTDSWWCPGCREVPPDVTFDERCTRCGSHVATLHQMAEDLCSEGWAVSAPRGRALEVGGET